MEKVDFLQGFAPCDEPKVLLNKTSKPTKIFILHQYGNSMKSSIALTAVESKDDVYETMRGVFGSDAYSKRFETLIRGAKWVNKVISLLSHTRWALRSWDIFLVAARQVSYYARFNDFSIEPRRLLDGLKTQIHDDSYPKNTTDTSVPLAIPLIINEIFKDSTSLSEICECLGYTYSKVESHRALFNNTFQRTQRSEQVLWRATTDLPDIHVVEGGHRASRSIATAGATTGATTSSIQRGPRFHGSSAVGQHYGHGPNTTKRHKGSKEAGRLEEHRTDNSEPAPTDGRYQRTSNQTQIRSTPAVPQSENEFDNLFGNLPGLQDDIDCQSHPADLEPAGAELTTVSENLGVSNPWFSTYLNPEISESAPQRGSIGTGEAWFSTYPNLQLGESVPQAGSIGTSEAWFGTYPNPQLSERGSLGISDAWFSTYPNPQLGESVPQGESIGTGDAWFSTYRNS
ncbi:hypothetical protein N7522_007563 [Penicillium canescens]|uniref:Uncharacterized protein n=1 Tax=Penicillium canescens TaxID=5083 RepID=A0AAD6I5B4_PENCN|nr:hypothetical protein N7522_007563 [Penicillium canescens]KAJ6030945.1 hypothetical protein N7460_010007 [Penicillium canescens]